MKPILLLIAAVASFVIAATTACFGQQPQPRVQNAKLETHTASPTLESQFKSLVQSQTGAAWIGYAVPRVQRPNSDDFEGSWGCALEDGRNGIIVRDNNTPVPLEGPTTMFVLFRVAANAVEKLRTVAPDCLLDAGGLPFYWLTNVRPAESVAMLEGMLKEDKPIGNLTYAIAVTNDPASDAALNRMVDPSQPEKIRQKAVNWLPDRGRSGYDTLLRVLRDDTSEKVRRSAISALARSKEADAIPTVIRVAREDKDKKIREAAVQSLARSKDPRAVRFFQDVLR
jgi:hypothetical protein